jgi:Holliday junction resolvase RusA-like endonuclease
MECEASGPFDRRRGDVDNLGKAVLELLQAHRVIEDDAQVVSLTSRWDSTITPGRLQVAVTGAQPPAIR